MNSKIQYAERNTNVWSRFCKMVRKTNTHPSRNGLEFYSYSGIPALLTMQGSLKPEQR